MRISLAILWVLVISIGQLVAQSSSIIRKITTKDRSPVPNVSLTIKGANTDITIVADGTTDSGFRANKIFETRAFDPV